MRRNKNRNPFLDSSPHSVPLNWFPPPPSRQARGQTLWFHRHAFITNHPPGTEGPRGAEPSVRLGCSSHAARASHLRAAVAAPQRAAQETKPSNAEAMSRIWLTAVMSGGLPHGSRDTFPHWYHRDQESPYVLLAEEKRRSGVFNIWP